MSIHDDGGFIVTSRNAMLNPMFACLKEQGSKHTGITVFDKMTVNAAALLCVVAWCTEESYRVITDREAKLANRICKQYYCP